MTALLHRRRGYSFSQPSLNAYPNQEPSIARMDPRASTNAVTSKWLSSKMLACMSTQTSEFVLGQR